MNRPRPSVVVQCMKVRALALVALVLVALACGDHPAARTADRSSAGDSPSAAPETPGTRTPTPGETPRPVPNPTSSPTPASEPAGGLEAELAAQAVAAGAFEGGFWAVRLTSGALGGPETSLLISADGGATWSRRDPAGGARPDAVFALDANRIWMVTHPRDPAVIDGSPALVVSRSTDGGRSWSDADVAFPDMNVCTWPSFAPDTRIVFVDADHGVLVNEPPSCPDAHGLAILTTSDGGTTWTVTGSIEQTPRIWSVAGATTVWIAPMRGSSLLRVTRDGGATWSDVALPGLTGAPPSDTEFVSAIRFDDTDRGVVAVARAADKLGTEFSLRFFVTLDGGATWTQAATVPAANPHPSLIDAAHWLAVSGPFRVRATDDGGRTWSDRGVAGPSSLPEPGAFADPMHGEVLVSLALPAVRDSVLYVTRDGGSSWHAAPFGPAAPPEPVDAATDRVGAGDFAFTLGDTLPDGDVGWRLLSGYSQAAFGSEAAFRRSETAYHDRQVSTSLETSKTIKLDEVSGPRLGPIWTDVLKTADAGRAYLVELDHVDRAGRQGVERLLVAPLRATGGLRIWVVEQK